MHAEPGPPPPAEDAPGDEAKNADPGAGPTDSAGHPPGDPTLWRWLSIAVLAYAVAVVAQYGVIRNGATGIGLEGASRALIPPLLLLGPMIAAAALATWGAGARGAARLLGLRITPVDLLIGSGAGLLLRALTALITLALLGGTGLGSQPLLGGVDGWFYVSAILFPVLITPVVEEIFFRGVLQRATIAGLRRLLPGWAAAAVGIATTSLMFTALHSVVGVNGAAALNSALIIFSLGTAAGLAAVLTRRIGLSIVLHVVFNAVAVWMTWPL